MCCKHANCHKGISKLLAKTNMYDPIAALRADMFVLKNKSQLLIMFYT